MKRLLIFALGVALAGCRTSEVQPETSSGTLVDSDIAAASAGDSGWRYAQRAAADLDDDSQAETAVLISDVSLDPTGRPLWEDGHRWQVYIEEATGERTYAYAKFLPNGKLTAEVSRRPSGSLSILLIAQTPERVTVHELKYLGPKRVILVNSLERDLDRRLTFSGSPRP